MRARAHVGVGVDRGGGSRGGGEHGFRLGRARDGLREREGVVVRGVQRGEGLRGGGGGGRGRVRGRVGREERVRVGGVVRDGGAGRLGGDAAELVVVKVEFGGCGGWRMWVRLRWW